MQFGWNLSGSSRDIGLKKEKQSQNKCHCIPPRPNNNHRIPTWPNKSHFTSTGPNKSHLTSIMWLDGAEVSASGWGSGGPWFQSHPRLTFQSCSRYQLNQLGSKAASESTFKKSNIAGYQIIDFTFYFTGPNKSHRTPRAKQTIIALQQGQTKVISQGQTKVHRNPTGDRAKQKSKRIASHRAKQKSSHSITGPNKSYHSHRAKQKSLNSHRTKEKSSNFCRAKQESLHSHRAKQKIFALPQGQTNNHRTPTGDEAKQKSLHSLRHKQKSSHYHRWQGQTKVFALPQGQTKDIKSSSSENHHGTSQSFSSVASNKSAKYLLYYHRAKQNSSHSHTRAKQKISKVPPQKTTMATSYNHFHLLYHGSNIWIVIHPIAKYLFLLAYHHHLFWKRPWQ